MREQRAGFFFFKKKKTPKQSTSIPRHRATAAARTHLKVKHEAALEAHLGLFVVGLLVVELDVLGRGEEVKEGRLRLRDDNHADLRGLATLGLLLLLLLDELDGHVLALVPLDLRALRLGVRGAVVEDVRLLYRGVALVRLGEDLRGMGASEAGRGTYSPAGGHAPCW